MQTHIHNYIGHQAVFVAPRSLALLERTKRLAQVDASVLIEGESGSGKEVLARALHAESLRSSKPWVDVSCAALPEHLVESELFGYEKGAFSGALGRKEGFFELAHTGTLFLDEIGELPPKMQAKLLRVLDGGTFYRLGGTKRIEVDVRVLAATNRDLREAVAAGEFRKDLYHRLAQIRLQALPLRERREDIPAIADLFLSRERSVRRLSGPACEALCQYSWPGNVRDLRNAVISAAAMSDGDEIQISDLPEEVRTGVEWRPRTAPAAAAGDVDWPVPGSGGLLEELERRAILDVLQRTGGHHETAARELGISTKTLSRKLRGYMQPGLEDAPARLVS